MNTPFVTSIRLPARNALALVAAFSLTPAIAHADTFVSGNISGTWATNGSPYIVQSNLSVAFGTQLTIDPGVVVRFQTNTGLEIRGTLVAEGTPTNQIFFTSDQTVPKPGDWAGISGISGDVGTAAIQLGNCQVEYAADAIYGKASASYSTAQLSLNVHGTAVHSCSGRGIVAVGIGSPVRTFTSGGVFLSVSGCNVYSNGLSGISCSASRGANNSDGYVQGGISHCRFTRNGQYGVSTWANSGSLPEVSNNVMWGNASSGIDMWGRPYSTIRNNIIVSNAVGVSGTLSTGYPASITFNDVWGNGANWTGDAAPYATAVGNISANPLCANPEAGDFHLRAQAGRYDPATATWIRDPITSPCIDAGDPASAWANEPQPNGGRINLGIDGNTPFASKTLPKIRCVLNQATKNVVLSWDCAPGETYTVLHSISLSGPWLDDLPGCPLTAGSSQTSLSYTNINGGAQTMWFYRVRWNMP